MPSPAETPQPSLLLVVLTQEVERIDPVCLRTMDDMEQEGAVWRVIWLNDFCESGRGLTVSKMSTSPLRGQLEGSVSQRAGQVAQPTGVWRTIFISVSPCSWSSSDQRKVDRERKERGDVENLPSNRNKLPTP